MKTVLVCRMESNRLPGKTLMPFGDHDLLSHIVARIERAGIAAGDICIATSSNAADTPIIDKAAELGCVSFAGSPDDVSRRILGAADDAEGFLLMLGDNPWIDTAQIAALAQKAGEQSWDYLVSATQELPEPNWPSRLYPIGTRLQYIRTQFMADRLAMLDNAETQEHTSKLFRDLPEDTITEIISPDDGWGADRLDMLNVSINTEADYQRALAVLQRVGPDAHIADVTDAYFEMNGEVT